MMKRAMKGKTPNSAKRAIVGKAPKDYERASMLKTPKHRKRARVCKTPKRRQRAMMEQTTTFGQRANVMKAPIQVKRAFTVAQVHRRACYRCGRRPGYSTWDICSDRNRPRVLCGQCDLELNRIVLCWAGHRDWRAMLHRYEQRLRDQGAL